MKDKKGYIQLIIVILLLAGALALTAKLKDFFDYPKLGNDKEYKHQIDSLAGIIQQNNIKVQSLDSLSRAQQERVTHLESELSQLNWRTNQNLKRYEKELDRLNNLTDSQLVIKFTDVFDYD